MSFARAFLVVPGVLFLTTFSASPVAAHAFGTRYDLPLPLEMYLIGAGAAVALSFVIMAMFFRERGEVEEAWNFDLLGLPVLGWFGHPVCLTLVKLVSVAVFALLLAAGFSGSDSTLKNIAPVFVWVIWWVGMAFVSALLGNVWSLVNPWKILFDWSGKLLPVARAKTEYPATWGFAPALILFLIFAWLELISEQGEHPRNLAWLIVAYSLITWVGMARYGVDSWLRYGEAFSVVFGLFARFGPLNGRDGRWHLRLPSVGLLSHQPLPMSGVFFVLLLLATVTFDGILETPLWAGMLDGIATSKFLRPMLLALQESGVELLVLIKSLALVLLPALFVSVYLLVCMAIARAGGGSLRTTEVAGYFVLSLIPIAIAYHLSHYLSYLLIAGQNIIPLVSDPFGHGWNLFGTRDYRVDIGIVSAKVVWDVAVNAIVLGHVMAVYVAHVMAMRVFSDRRAALRSQLPMLVLMVVYTMLSLWILSQPIVA
jgi:hypothetical protein